MKKITLLLCLFIAYSLNAQTTLFEDDFESYSDFIITGIGDWLTLDLDGLPTYTGGDSTFDNANDPMAFLIFNPSVAGSTNESDAGTGEVRNFDPYNGLKYAAAWAAVPGDNPANDDWLISPVISLADSDNTVSFQVKAMSNSYGNESYTVGVYVGTGNPTSSSDFTVISANPETATYPDWELKSYALTAYDNMDVRIGIHYTSSDVYMLMVDDFKVVTTSLSVGEFELNTFSHYYNKNTKILSLESSNLPLTGIDIYNVFSV